MHHSAFKIGGLVMAAYCPRKPSILEIGSHDVNGSLRKQAPRGARYVGLDFDAGLGVDFVVAPGEPWPVQDEDFDFVMASSVFEHDSAFWLTFLDMCRKTKAGGHIYVSAPSNGTVHRYPLDCWRFYPDAAVALQRWAAREGVQVSLVESFVAEREMDVWNDFCAVFRKEPASGALNSALVCEQVPCTNVITWRDADVIRPRDLTEDMVLQLRHREEVERLNQHSADLYAILAAEQAKWEAAHTNLQRRLDEAIGAYQTLQKQLTEHQSLFAQQVELLAADAAEARSIFEGKLAQQQSDFAAERDQLLGAEAILREELVRLAGELEASRARASEQPPPGSVQDELTGAVAKLERALAAGIDSQQARSRSAEVQYLQQCITELQELANQQREQIRIMREENDRQAEENAEPVAEIAEVGAEAPSERASREQLEAMLERKETLINRLRADADEATVLKNAILKMEDRLAAAEEELEKERGQVRERFRELAYVTTRLLKEEERSAQQLTTMKWLLDVTRVLLVDEPMWWGLMPRRWRRERQMRRLARRQLFDSKAYAEQYPDVIAAGQDPLRHYIYHGLEENRLGTR
jgi:SAM-dependent methyltransferase